MILHPDVRALRGDDAPQREAQDLLEALHREWREGRAAAVLSDLAAFDTARPLSECPALAALFEEGDASASRFVEASLWQCSAVSPWRRWATCRCGTRRMG